MLFVLLGLALTCACLLAQPGRILPAKATRGCAPSVQSQTSRAYYTRFYPNAMGIHGSSNGDKISCDKELTNPNDLRDKLKQDHLDKFDIDMTELAHLCANPWDLGSKVVPLSVLTNPSFPRYYQKALSYLKWCIRWSSDHEDMCSKFDILLTNPLLLDDVVGHELAKVLAAITKDLENRLRMLDWSKCEVFANEETPPIPIDTVLPVILDRTSSLSNLLFELRRLHCTPSIFASRIQGNPTQVKKLNDLIREHLLDNYQYVSSMTNPVARDVYMAKARKEIPESFAFAVLAGICQDETTTDKAKE